VAALLAGCGKPPTLVQKYVWEYPPPAPRASQSLDEGIKVEQFAVAQAFNSTAMVYRPHPYKSESYTYHRWRVNPGYMATDYLLRDLRQSGLFKAVLPAASADKGRFLVEGGVEEIQEVDEPDAWKAALALNITLLDLSARETTRRVVFQKSYRAEEPLAEKTPAGLAQGMSRAMARLSGEIVTDLYQAARARVK
jgi:cholesterol transport system auxiliary component